MPGFDYDLFVIGGGSGGVRAARMAAETGARVGLAEESRYGGTCVIRGCVPKKLMVYASSVPATLDVLRGYGWRIPEATHDWPAFTAKRTTEIARLEAVYRRNLERAGCDLFDCRATLADPHSVHLAAAGRTVSAKHILVATGGRPRRPDLPGAEHAIVSDDIFDLKERPARAILVGGGYIAAEFAGILNGLGVQTTLAYRGELFLRGFDREVRQFVAEEMRRSGVDLRFDTDIARIDRDGAGGEVRRVTFKSGETAEAELVFLATGRVPNTDGMGLEEAGVRLRHNGAIEVDAWSQTSVPSIYAVGDVTGRLELTPVAIREGAAFVETVFRANPTRFDHDLVPTAIFTQPEIGTVGSNEDACRAERRAIDVYVTSFRAMYHAYAGSERRMLMKLIVDRTDGRVCGCHIAGDGAGEMIQMAGIAIRMGATKEDFDRTCAVHPTAAEELVTMATPTRSFGEAAGDQRPSAAAGAGPASRAPS